MMLSNITPRERRYLEALADAYTEAQEGTTDEKLALEAFEGALARLLLGEGDRDQLLVAAAGRAVARERDDERQAERRARERIRELYQCCSGSFTCSRCGTTYVEELDPIDASSDREESEDDEPATP